MGRDERGWRLHHPMDNGLVDIVVRAKMGRATAIDNGSVGLEATKESIPASEALNNPQRRL